MKKPKRLIDLVSVGKATVEDFESLGITEIEHLVDKNADELYDEIQRIKGCRMDPCVHDVFRCAIEQARNPELSAEKKQWWYWSKVRKGILKG